MNDKLDIYFSKVFCRMRHKTQLFNGAADDHYHTRLQHTIEVEEIALRMAKGIMKNGPTINIDLSKVSTIALLHDIGHTPFGHAGERALHEMVSGKCSCQYGLPDFNKLNVAIGFKHNLNSGLLYIEHTKYGFVDYDVLDGIVKHTKLRHDEKDTFDYGFEYIFHGHEEYYSNPKPNTIEGFIVAYADEIAQVCSDYLDICLDARSRDEEEEFNCPPYNRLKDLAYEKRENANKACDYLIKSFCRCFKHVDDYKHFQKNSFTKMIKKFGEYRSNFINKNAVIKDYDEEKKDIVKTLFAYYYLHPENMSNDFFGDFVYRITGKIKYSTAQVFIDARKNTIDLDFDLDEKSISNKESTVLYIERVKKIVEVADANVYSKSQLKDYKNILKLFIRSIAVHISKMTDNYAYHKYMKILDNKE